MTGDLSGQWFVDAPSLPGSSHKRSASALPSKRSDDISSSIPSSVSGLLGENDGIIPRAIVHIFDHIERGQQEGMQYLVRVSYLEIYNEKVYDLLGDVGGTSSRTALDVRENKYGFYVPKLCHINVDSRQGIMHLIRCGNQNRIVSATAQNSESSRSHAMLTIEMEKTRAKNTSQQDDTANDSLQSMVFKGKMLTGKLNLVDLAGSERFDASTQNQQGEAHKTKASETVNINQV